jgi:hypothetical protein
MALDHPREDEAELKRPVDTVEAAGFVANASASSSRSTEEERCLKGGRFLSLDGPTELLAMVQAVFVSSGNFGVSHLTVNIATCFI